MCNNLIITVDFWQSLLEVLSGDDDIIAQCNDDNSLKGDHIFTMHFIFYIFLRYDIFMLFSMKFA